MQPEIPLSSKGRSEQVLIQSSLKVMKEVIRRTEQRPKEDAS